MSNAKFKDWSLDGLSHYKGFNCPGFDWYEVMKSEAVDNANFKYGYIPPKPCPLCFKSDPNTCKNNLFWVKYIPENTDSTGYISICNLHKIQVDFLLENCLEDYNAINNAIENLEYNKVFDRVIKAKHVFNGEYLQELFRRLNSENIRNLEAHMFNCSELLYVYFTSEHRSAEPGIVRVKEFGLWYGTHEGKYLIDIWNLTEMVEPIVSNLSEQDLNNFYPKMNLRVPEKFLR